MPKNALFAILTAMHKLNFTVTDTIKDIPEKDWDGLFGKELIEGYGFHKTIEEAGLKEFSLKFLLGRRNGELTVIIPFFTTDFSFTTIIQGPTQKLISGVQKIFKRFLKAKILFVGFPTCEELYIGISAQENLQEIINQALIEFYRLSKKERVSAMLFYNLAEKHQVLAAHITKKGFTKMENFPNSVIEINAASIDDYIDGLGKNTRKNIRKKIKETLTLAKLKTEITENIDNIKDKIYQLYMNNFDDSDIHFETLTPEFFTQICRNMPGIAKFFIVRDDKNIISFNLLFIKGKTAIDKFIGFDKELSRKYHLYYVTFANNIDYCIKNDLCFYQMGITDYQPKIRLGAKLIPLHIYVKIFNPFLNIFSKIIVRFVEPTRYDPALKHLRQLS